MKSGFVMLAGRSNVGKSTLLNSLIGSKVSIVTPKPQTTRHPIRGVLHDPRGQLVFIDTPGVFLGRRDPVSLRLNTLVEKTLDGVDAIVYVCDPARPPGKEEERIQTLLKRIKTPILVVVNKSDLTEAQRPSLPYFRKLDVGQQAKLEVSALNAKNLTPLVDALFSVVPEGPMFYPDLQLTDLSHHQWIEELIREKIFLQLDQELPYSIHVVADHIETKKNGTKLIQATIYTTNDRYKRMIIGAGAQRLKAIGKAAREEIETVTQLHVFLELEVKVDAKWPERWT